MCFAWIINFLWQSSRTIFSKVGPNIRALLPYCPCLLSSKSFLLILYLHLYWIYCFPYLTTSPLLLHILVLRSTIPFPFQPHITMDFHSWPIWPHWSCFWMNPGSGTISECNCLAAAGHFHCIFALNRQINSVAESFIQILPNLDLITIN